MTVLVAVQKKMVLPLAAWINRPPLVTTSALPGELNSMPRPMEIVLLKRPPEMVSVPMVTLDWFRRTVPGLGAFVMMATTRAALG